MAICTICGTDGSVTDDPSIGPVAIADPNNPDATLEIPDVPLPFVRCSACGGRTLTEAGADTVTQAVSDQLVTNGVITVQEAGMRFGGMNRDQLL